MASACALQKPQTPPIAPIRRTTRCENGPGPSTREDPAALWTRLEALLATLARADSQRLAGAALESHGEALRVHPAAKSIHHAFRGGLLEHTVSMMGLAARAAEHYPELDRDLLLLGVLFHDLGKIVELGVLPGSEYTAPGRLVGHIVIGRDLLRAAAARVPELPADRLLQLEHLLLAHQGRQEYGSPVEPATAEALAPAAIDDLDSKLALLRQLRETHRGFLPLQHDDRSAQASRHHLRQVPQGDRGHRGAPHLPLRLGTDGRARPA